MRKPLFIAGLVCILLILIAFTNEPIRIAEATSITTTTPKPAQLIFIDPGHQKKGNNELEQIGQNSKVKKPKVSSGTKGVSSKKAEYALNLEVSLLLRDLLLKEGYRVQLTRDKNEVDISNKARALMANAAKADLLVRIHADGNDKASVNGISVQYPSENSFIKAELVKPSKQAATDVLSELLKATGAKSRGIVPRSDLTGFNWAKVPSILVEMGFMTNKQEDSLMATPAYQEKLARGMLAGIKLWLSEG